MALDLLRRSAYCKRKRRWVRAHHGGARRREHVRGRGAAIVGTSGDLPSAASEKGPERVPKPRGNIIIVLGIEHHRRIWYYTVKATRHAVGWQQRAHIDPLFRHIVSE